MRSLAVSRVHRSLSVLRFKGCASPPAFAEISQTHLVWPSPEKGRRLLSSNAAEGVLVRDFIHDSLYSPEHGYFSGRSPVVGQLPAAIDFKQLFGQSAYLRLLERLYAELGTSWLTPVELFQPWYGRALAEFIRQRHLSTAALRQAQQQDAKQPPLKVYEVGGGSGTCALNILDYLEEKAPHLYRHMSYTSVEISSSLAEQQQQKVHSKPQHRHRFSVEQRDAAERAGWGPTDDRPCFILMLEVLDNLPHDRVCRKSSGEPWLETRVHKCHLPAGSDEAGAEQRWEERLHPLRDPLLERCMRALRGESEQSTASDSTGHQVMSEGWLGRTKDWLANMLQPASSGPEVEWVPTRSLQLLDTLHAARPRMSLVAADFNELPDVRIDGKKAPLVASKVKGTNVDHGTYLVQPGSADIFFPIDFESLKALDMCAARTAASTASSRQSRRIHSVMSTGAFMDQFVDVIQTRTRSGYNPLLEDFTNTSVYVSMDDEFG